MEKSPKKYKLKIAFSSPVRIGSPGMDDQNVRHSIGADQFFSWISLGWIKLFGLGDYKNDVLNPFLDNDNPWIHSDLFPENYFPSPFVKNDSSDDVISKKDRTGWLTNDGFIKILKGKSPAKEDYKNPITEHAIQMAHTNAFTADESQPFITTALTSKKDEPVLSMTGFFDLHKEGLEPKINKVLEFMKDEGFGANRTSGLGRIEEVKLEEYKPNFPSIDNPKRYITLCDFYPASDDEIKLLSNDTDFAYKLVSKAGWIYDENGNPTDMRKQKIFLFSCGSSMKEKIKGKIVNVGYENNPSYRYAISYLIEAN